MNVISVSNISHNFLKNYNVNNTEISRIIAVFGAPIHSFIHEMAHKLFMDILYVEANSKIEFFAYGFFGGKTEGKLNQLSRVGRLFGDTVCKILICASGNLAVMTTLVALKSLSHSELVRNVCIYHANAIIIGNVLFEFFFLHETDFAEIYRLGGPFAYLTVAATCIFLAQYL